MQPLPDRPGVALSMCFCTWLFAYVAIVAIKEYRGTSRPGVGGGGAARRFLSTQFGVLFLNLTLADLIQGLGFGMSFAWLGRNGLDDPSSPSTTCTAQGAIIEIGDVAGNFSSMLIAFHTFLILVVGWNPPNVAVGAAIGSAWGLDILLTIIGPITKRDDPIPFYGPAGGWCWISTTHQVARLPFLYLWIFICCIVNVVCYFAVFVVIRRHSRRQRATRSDRAEQVSKYERIAKRMLVYPFVYILLVLPIATTRVLAMTGHNLNSSVLMATGAVYTSSGMINVIVYSLTRHMIQVSSFRSPRGTAHKGTASAHHGIGSSSTSARSNNRAAQPNSFLPVTISYEVHKHHDYRDESNSVRLATFSLKEEVEEEVTAFR